MAGIMEALFGADGIGGQSGAVGAIGDSVMEKGLLGTAMGGAGKIIAPIGNLINGGTGDWLSDVITKNPLEILKDPVSAFNDKGQLSLARILFPNYRRQAVEQRKMAAMAETMKTYGDLAKMFTDSKTDTSQGILRKGMVAQGADPAVLQPYADAAKAERHFGRRNQAAIAQEAQAMGMTPNMTQDMSSDELRALAIQQAHDKATLGQRTLSEARAARNEVRADQDQAAQDLRPPEIRRYEEDLKDFNNRNAGYAKDVLSAQDKAEVEAAKNWEAQQSADPANAGLLTIPPMTPEARAQARAQAAAEYEKAVPRPVPPTSPFTPRKVDGVIKGAVPATTRRGLGIRKAIKDDARALTKSGMDPVAAKYAAAFMRTIENPQAAAKILAPAKGETIDTVMAKIKAGVHVLKPGNEEMVMEALRVAGYGDDVLVAAGKILDAQQAR